MKKTYITPAISITRVNPEAMIAASGDEKTFNVSDEVQTSGYSDAKGSNYNVWDDDWSE